jgi:hypothetical protein
MHHQPATLLKTNSVKYYLLQRLDTFSETFQLVTAGMPPRSSFILQVHPIGEGLLRLSYEQYPVCHYMRVHAVVSQLAAALATNIRRCYLHLCLDNFNKAFIWLQLVYCVAQG